MENKILDKVCFELVKVMGPVAPVVMAEKIKNIGISHADFPKDKMAQLIEIISYEIQDDESRAQFQKGALEQLKYAETRADV